MRRAVIIVTALIAIGAATAAYASSGPYTGSLTFSAKHSGTPKQPAPIAFKLNVNSTAPSAMRPPVQLDIKVRIYGMKLDGKDFPSCQLSAIATAHNDTFCPRGSKSPPDTFSRYSEAPPTSPLLEPCATPGSMCSTAARGS